MEQKEITKKNQTVIYLNKYEDPGSLSGITTPSNIQIANKSESIHADQIWDEETWKI